MVDNNLTFKKILQQFFATDKGKQVLAAAQKLSGEKNFVPQVNYLFRPYQTPEITPDNVRVMIFIDDVIPDVKLADGFALSSLDNHNKHPMLKKLLNIMYHSQYSYLNPKEFADWFPGAGIIPWVKKGILPVNIHLSTTNGILRAHKDKIDWLSMAQFVIERVSEHRDNPDKPIFFILIGEEANKLLGHIRRNHHNTYSAPGLSDDYKTAPEQEKALINLLSQHFVNFYPDNCIQRSFYYAPAVNSQIFDKLYAEFSVKEKIPFNPVNDLWEKFGLNPAVNINFGPNFKFISNE